MDGARRLYGCEPMPPSVPKQGTVNITRNGSQRNWFRPRPPEDAGFRELALVVEHVRPGISSLGEAILTSRLGAYRTSGVSRATAHAVLPLPPATGRGGGRERFVVGPTMRGGRRGSRLARNWTRRLRANWSLEDSQATQRAIKGRGRERIWTPPTRGC
jgi:hypothetical protein